MKQVRYDPAHWDFMVDPENKRKKMKQNYVNPDGEVKSKLGLGQIKRGVRHERKRIEELEKELRFLNVDIDLYKEKQKVEQDAIE